MSILERLQSWYMAQCDGEWEHQQGISVASLDNPGWCVRVNLAGTPLAQRDFVPIKENVDEARFPAGPRWLCCLIEDETWIGAGDETTLERILTTFLKWADAEHELSFDSDRMPQ